MTANILASVNSDFASWYAELLIGDDASLRELRYKGVVAAVGLAKSDMLETWVRLAFKSKKAPPSEAIEAFRKSLQVDESVPLAGNAREIQILAASCLALMMEKRNATAALAALAVTTASCQMTRTPDLPMDLVSRADVSLANEAELRRNRPNSQNVLLGKPPEFNFSTVIKKIEANQNFPGVNEGLGLMEEVVRGAMKTMAGQMASAVSNLQLHLKMKDEELQMLWWLTSGQSIDLKCDFSRVDGNAQPLIFASELAKLTEILPGPNSVEGLLSRAGVKQRKKMKISTAVNAVPLDWAKTILEEEEFSPVTAPIHFAIARRIETEAADDTWVANWASVAEIPASQEMSGIDLGVQFYRERLLALHI